MKRPPLWFVIIVGWLLVAVLVCAVPACGTRIDATPPRYPTPPCPSPADQDKPSTPTPKQAERPQDAITETSHVLGWVGAICTAVSALAAVASFFVPIIPRRGALLALAGSLGLGIVRAALIAYGLATAHVLFWLSVAAVIAAVVFVAVPLALAWRNQLLKNTSARLAAAGDARASVALATEAMPTLYPNKATRKAAVAALAPAKENAT